MPDHKQRWKLVLLGLPVLVVVLASIALTAYLSFNLISQGIANGQAGPLILGSLIAAMWLLMFYKTAKARLMPRTAQKHA